MSDRHLIWCGRYSLLISSFTCLLALIAVRPAWAQRTPAEMDRAITDLQTRIDALQKETEIVGFSSKFDAFGKDLAELKQAIHERTPAAPAPPEAWSALGIVGALFVLAWGFVSAMRERSRRQEAVLSAVRRLGVAVSQEAINSEVRDQIRELQSLLADTADGSLSLSGLLRRLFTRK
jgi:hypothetical protein